MAPSPTGFLHIGGVRTFLFNWLFARGARRRVPAADREHRHEPRGRRVGRADPALAALARDRLGRRDVRSSSTGSSAAARRRRRLVAEGTGLRGRGRDPLPHARRGRDRLGRRRPGRIEFPNEKLEDVVLVRSDGRPTYNFASPVEDWLDAITHVIRGDDHVSNTPKQIQILHALGAEPPVYAHVPNVLRRRTARSSRSATARVSVDEFRHAGYIAAGADELPRAARLGARRRDDDHVAATSSSSASRSSASARARPRSTTTKLDWMNGVYLRALAPEDYADRSSPTCASRASTGTRRESAQRRRSCRRRSRRSGEFPEFAGFLFHDVEPDPAQLDPDDPRAPRRRRSRPSSRSPPSGSRAR